MSAQKPTQKTKQDSTMVGKQGKSVGLSTGDDDSPGRRSARIATQVDKFVKPTWETLLEAKQNITDKESAIKYLNESGYIEDTMSINLDHLSYALMLFSAATSLRALQEGARAVAILLKESSNLTRDELIGDILDERLTPTVNQLAEIKEELETTVRQLKATSLTQKQETTYATVTKRRPGTRGSPTDIKRRQILIEQEGEGEYPHALLKLTEEQIVAKANEAVSIAKIRGIGECRIISAKKLQRGGVVLELNTTEAADIIRHRKTDFCKSFSPMAQLRERNYTVKLNFVPVTHDVNSGWERQRIEERSGLQNDQLVATTWIKPVNHRKEHQEVAILIARFKSPEAANKVIKDGMVIQGKRVRGNKMTNSPIRCFHCQRYGHFATNCPQKQEPTKCPTCTGPHRREECEETRKQDFKCPNCKKKGHAAWDPECEHYKEQLERLIKGNTEMQYRYYPTDEEWTWEKDPVYEVSTEERNEIQTERAIDEEEHEEENEEENEHEEGEWREARPKKGKHRAKINLTQTTLEGFACKRWANSTDNISEREEEVNE